uniref:RGS domain-containing protein n=1 Tax=Anopheles maculatus TaxID=74869 RepID=A0A182S748_9DIPT
MAADEHRVDLAYEVAKRYLGLCTESQREDSGGGGGCDSDGGKCDDDSGIGGDTKKLSNHDDPEKSLTGSNSVTTNTINNEKDEFVLDVLNDDMVTQVRTKLSTGSKELFEASITAVRAFLAGEPFREFEASMYFHRYVRTAGRENSTFRQWLRTECFRTKCSPFYGTPGIVSEDIILNRFGCC